MRNATTLSSLSVPVRSTLSLSLYHAMAGDASSTTKHIWSPAGGWYSDPRHWRRNTVLAFAALAGAAFYIGRASAKREVRHAAPVRPIPSRRWANVPPPRSDAIGGAP